MNPSMMRALTAVAAVLALLPTAFPASDDPAAVLILANVQTVAEEGTRGKRAGVWVAERYAEARGVPKGNIVRLSVPLACCRNSPAAWDSFNISFERYKKLIERPVLEHMEKKGITNRIRYIVPTYGIPTRVYDVANGASVDSYLAGMAYGNDAPRMLNPYRGAVERLQPAFAQWVDPSVPRPYLVTRLDGPSAVIAAGLVDKALRAEKALNAGSGVGYFDYRGVYDPNGRGGNARADASVVRAHELVKAQGFETVFNTNGSQIGAMIHSAPRTAWAWGWYSGNQTWDGYEFVEGAVAAQLTSFTAIRVRSPGPGAWVPLWLEAGVTATWGATAEPYVSGYALADVLFAAMFAGRNFAEAAYQATPQLNWMMIFIGDPLYAPEMFQQPRSQGPPTPARRRSRSPRR